MKILRRLLPYFRGHWLHLSVALGTMAGVAGLTGAAMWLVKKVVDKALTAGNLTLLGQVIVGILVIYLLKATLSCLHNYLITFIGASVVRRLRDDIYAHTLTLSMDFFSANDSSRIVSRLTNDAQLLQNVLTNLPVMVVRDGLTVLCLAGVLIALQWKFALGAFVLLPLCGTLLARFGMTLRKNARLGQAKTADLFVLIREAVVGVSVVKAFQRETHEGERFRRENQALCDIEMKNARIDALSPPLMEFLGTAGMATLLWLGGLDVIRGHWTTGAFFAFLAAALSLFQPVKNFSRSNANLQQALSAAERLFWILDHTPSLKEKPGATPLAHFSSEIHFDHVGFYYQPGRTVLEDVDLRIQKGQMVALVGPSGSGKTTLAGLLLRFYDPTQGAVRLDGRDVRDLPFSSLRGRIGLVTQDNLLFNDTVRANIAYGRLRATETEIVEAARAANAWEFIASLPLGLDTPIGERGLQLSGGQRQRLAIARAILKAPDILVLDEATSALDTASETLVQEALERLMQGRTTLVIAHRLATVKKADHIVVLERGRIQEEGTHEILLKRKGLYSKLHALQF